MFAKCRTLYYSNTCDTNPEILLINILTTAKVLKFLQLHFSLEFEYMYIYASRWRKGLQSGENEDSGKDANGPVDDDGCSKTILDLIHTYASVIAAERA